MTLISERHRRLYLDYYASRVIESRPSIWLERVEELAKWFKAGSILDYGCGQARCISKFSRFTVRDYDPGVEGCSDPPAPADLVVSIHTLEHVEPECIDAVLAHMVGLAKKAIFVVVCTNPSTKSLTDGSPWHSLVRDAGWWEKKLDGFEPQTCLRPGTEYAALKTIDE